jgi:capsular polysaccharide biosynthesis protein
MGWDKTHLDQVLADESFRSVQTQPERRQRLPGKYVVLGCPGVFTYGHFLVDISIRIQLVKEMALHAGAKYLIPAPTHPWQLAILEVAGISPDDCVAVGNADSFQLEEMLVPVVTGLNGVLNRVLAQRTFRRMKEVMNNIAGPKSSERSLIFPLHTTMSSVHHPRGVEQRDLIVRTLQKDFGVEAFDPLQLSFAQQVDKFRNARLVVGEDSSALHNILWSDGADLAVMAPKGQFNYYHIGLQAIDGGRTAILWGDVTDQERGRFQMNLDSLCTTVEGLLREHRAPEFDIPLIAGSSH